jgi:hypothetical protein
MPIAVVSSVWAYRPRWQPIRDLENEVLDSLIGSLLGGRIGSSLTGRFADRAARHRLVEFGNGRPIVISSALRRVHRTAVLWVPGDLTLGPDGGSWRGRAGGPKLDLPRVATSVDAADDLNTDEVWLGGGRAKVLRMTTAGASYYLAFHLRDLVAVRTAFAAANVSPD